MSSVVGCAFVILRSIRRVSEREREREGVVLSCTGSGSSHVLDAGLSTRQGLCVPFLLGLATL